MIPKIKINGLESILKNKLFHLVIGLLGAGAAAAYITHRTNIAEDLEGCLKQDIANYRNITTGAPMTDLPGRNTGLSCAELFDRYRPARVYTFSYN